MTWETEEGQEVCLLSVVDAKTGSPRRPIVYHQKAAAMLRDYMMQTRGEFLFPSPRGDDGPLNAQTLWIALQRAKEEAKIEKRVYGYLFRHMFASKEGDELSQAERDEQLGWRTDMWRRYTHLATRKRVRTALKLGVGRPVIENTMVADVLHLMDLHGEFLYAIMKYIPRTPELVALGDEIIEAGEKIIKAGGG